MLNKKLLYTAIAVALHTSTAQAFFDNGVAAGDVTQTSAVLWAHSTAKDAQGQVPVVFKYGTDPTLTVVDGTQTVVQNSYAEAAKLQVGGLSPGTIYYYRAEDAKGVSVTGQFKTLPASNSQPGLRLGILSNISDNTNIFPNNMVSLNNDLNIAGHVYMGSALLANLKPFRQYFNVSGLQQTINRSLEAVDGLAPTLANLRRAAAFHHVMGGWDLGLPQNLAGGAAPSTEPDLVEQDVAYINATGRYQDGVRTFRQAMPMLATDYGETGDPRTANRTKFYRRFDYGKSATVITLDANSFRDAPVTAPTNPIDPAQVQQFLLDAATPGRTALGLQQLADLKADLLAAEQAGIQWKFVHGAPALQNLGPLGIGQHRYEGYAAERNELLAYIKAQAIRNVVFISNQMEGVWINNLTYQDTLGGAQQAVDSFEINIGTAAPNAQLTSSLQRRYTPGNALVELGLDAKLVTPGQAAFYDTLPDTPDTDSLPNDKDDFIKYTFNNALLPSLGYNPLGLDDAGLNAALLAGDYVSLQKSTWANFVVNPKSHVLTVTVYGADSVAGQLDPKAARELPIRIVSQFKVAPK